MKDTALEQMELGMRNQIRNNYRNARRDRMKRAHWWFNRMREVVDLALPPRRVDSPRAEQTYLPMRQTNLL